MRFWPRAVCRKGRSRICPRSAVRALPAWRCWNACGRLKSETHEFGSTSPDRGGTQLRILPRIELAVLPAACPLHPGVIVAVPANRLLQAALPRLARTPAQLGFDLGGIDGVAAIVSRPVLDIADERIGFAHG